MNQFRQPYVGWRVGMSSMVCRKSIPGLLIKRFTNSGSVVLLGEHSWGGGRLTEGNSWGSGQSLSRELGIRKITHFQTKA